MNAAFFVTLLAVSPAAQNAEPPSAIHAPKPAPLMAQYDWGYVGADGEGKGTLSILVEPTTGKIVLELHGLGERLVLLQGDAETGYHLLIPRRNLDQHSASFAGLKVPFLPQLGGAQALHRLLTTGEGPGVKVTKRDDEGPVKLYYKGKDEQGKNVQVWMTRTRME
jgi:hypothetical protein